MSSTTSSDSDRVLRHVLTTDNSRSISILVVSNGVFCEKLYTALVKCFEENSSKYQLRLFLCENVNEVLENVKDLPADFVVFVMDTRVKTCVKDIEYNLQLMDKQFVSGRTCIVNGTAHIPRSNMGVTLNSINAIKYKYSCTLLNAHILDPTSCVQLVNRLLILITTSIGLKGNAPFVTWIQNECT